MYQTKYEFGLLILSFITVFLQIYVGYLVMHKSPRTMQEYRFFLIIFSFWDLIFTLTLGLFLQAFPITPLLAAKTHGLSYYFGDFACRATVGLAIYAGANVIMSQNYCLTYRYTILHQDKAVHQAFMSNYFRFGYLIFSQALSISLGVCMYKTMLPSEQAYKIIMDQTEDVRIQVKPTDMIVFIEFGFPFTQKLLITIVFLFMLAEIICISLICLIMAILRQNASLFSKNTYKLHFQFTLLLAIQLMTPVIFVVAPVTVCIIAVFMGKPSTELITQVGYSMLTLYGMTNSLFTILFVSPFRNHAFNKFMYPWLKPLLNSMNLGRLLPANGQPIPSLTFSHNTINQKRKNTVAVAGYFAGGHSVA